MAALAEQILRVGFLEIARTDLGRRDLGRDGEHRNARAVAVEQAVDEVQVARAAAARAHRQRAGQMRLGAGGESRDLLVTDVDPLDRLAAPERIGDRIEAVADNPVDPLDPGCGKRCDELIGNALRHHRPFELAGRPIAPNEPSNLGAGRQRLLVVARQGQLEHGDQPGTIILQLELAAVQMGDRRASARPSPAPPSERLEFEPAEAPHGFRAPVFRDARPTVGDGDGQLLSVLVDNSRISPPSEP